VTAYGRRCVLPFLPEFLARYPGIDLAISFHDGIPGVSRQAYDIRINWAEEPEKTKVSQVLCSLPMVLVGSPAYLAKRGTPTTPADLAGHDCLTTVLPDGSRAYWLFRKQLERKSGNRQKAVAVVPQGRVVVLHEAETVIDAARVGLGLTVASPENVFDALRDGSLVRLLPDYEILGAGRQRTEIIMQYSARNSLRPKVRVLVDFLLERLRGQNPLDIVGKFSAQSRRAS
jgi:DNA-binding transcriptional LysR family regulator